MPAWKKAIAASSESPPAEQWREALEELEASLRAATQSIAQLRRSLEAEPFGQADGAPAEPAKTPDATDAFDRLWERLESEKTERPVAEAAPQAASLAERVAALLPQQYMLTIEDGDRAVDLAQLHRALLRLAKPDDISLVSYANGTPVVSLRIAGELDVDKLTEAISETMDQDCELSQQDSRIRMRVLSRDRQGE
jgi:septal ring factor EnvC (AmiA/AmiB activator)